MLVPISMSQNFPRQQVAGPGVPSTVDESCSQEARASVRVMLSCAWTDFTTLKTFCGWQ